jgi:hypothetical protein
MFNLFKTKKTKTQEVKKVEAVVAVPRRNNYTGGKTWTKEEDMIITGFYNLGIAPSYISEKLTECGYERSTNAVQIRISRLNKSQNEEA